MLRVLVVAAVFAACLAGIFVASGAAAVVVVVVGMAQPEEVRHEGGVIVHERGDRLENPPPEARPNVVAKPAQEVSQPELCALKKVATEKERRKL